MRRDHLRFKVIDVLHGLRCRGVVLHASDGILCLLCGKEWSCSCPEEGAPRLTCDDLGCVNGKTVQGRKYDYDGAHEDQWAPCGRRADTCVIPPAERTNDE